MELKNIKKFIRDLCNYDEGAYELLLDSYEKPVYRFFFFSHRNHQLAEEQSAETFEKFVTAIKNFKADNSVSLNAFVFGIARNVLLKGYRRGNLKITNGYDEEVLCDKAGVLRQVQGREQLARVMLEIDKLDHVQKEIFLLRFVEQLKINEISKIMDVPENTIKSHIHRTRKKLMETLSDKINYEV